MSSIHNHAVTFKMFETFIFIKMNNQNIIQTFIFIKMNNQNIIQQSSSVYLNNPNWQDLSFIQNEFITSY